MPTLSWVKRHGLFLGVQVVADDARVVDGRRADLVVDAARLAGGVLGGERQLDVAVLQTLRLALDRHVLGALRVELGQVLLHLALAIAQRPAEARELLRLSDRRTLFRATCLERDEQQVMTSGKNSSTEHDSLVIARNHFHRVQVNYVAIYRHMYMQIT